MIRILSAAILCGACFCSSPAVSAEPELPASCSDAALAKDIHSCDQAIAAEKDPSTKARLLYSRAYASNEAHRYEEAVRDLDAAIALQPDFASALQERAYAFGELSDYGRALKDLDREIALRPDYVRAYQERAYARHWSGDLAGAWEDYDREVSLEPGDPGHLIGRAEEAVWLGRFDDAAKDLAAAEALARKSGNEDALREIPAARRNIALLSTRTSNGAPTALCAAADKSGNYESPYVIGDCTAAFLAASTPSAKADMLTTRSVAWLIKANDETASTADRRVAAGLDPDNPDRHVNLGFSYLSVHHSWAAEREFDRGFGSRFSWIVYAGRASARYNLGRKEEAFADAKKSFEIRPNELALTVLGDLAHDRQDDKSAKLYWMGAYHLGDRDDGLTARLKSIGIDHPEREPPK